LLIGRSALAHNPPSKYKLKNIQAGTVNNDTKGRAAAARKEKKENMKNSIKSNQNWCPVSLGLLLLNLLFRIPRI